MCLLDRNKSYLWLVITSIDKNINTEWQAIYLIILDERIVSTVPNIASAALLVVRIKVSHSLKWRKCRVFFFCFFVVFFLFFVFCICVCLFRSMSVMTVLPVWINYKLSQTNHCFPMTMVTWPLLWPILMKSNLLVLPNRLLLLH